MRNNDILKKNRLQTILEQGLEDHQPGGDELLHAIWDAQELLETNKHQPEQYELAIQCVNATVRDLLTGFVGELANGLDMEDNEIFVLGVLFTCEKLCELSSELSNEKETPELWPEEMQNELSKDGLGKDELRKVGLGKDGQDDDD